MSAFVLQAYRDLVTCRIPDGPIPWDKVALYADKKQLEPDNAGRLWDIIRLMDQAERKWYSDELESGGGS